MNILPAKPDTYHYIDLNKTGMTREDVLEFLKANCCSVHMMYTSTIDDHFYISYTGRVSSSLGYTLLEDATDIEIFIDNTKSKRILRCMNLNNFL